MGQTARSRTVRHWLWSWVALSLLVAVGWYGHIIRGLAQPVLIKLTAPLTAAAETPPSLPDNSFSYPSLGISAPVTVSPRTSPLELKDWTVVRRSLQEGVHLSFPEDTWTESRFAYLTGHSSDSYPHRYSSVFAALGQAKPDDLFWLNVSGTTSAFRVLGVSVINPADIAVWDQLARQEGSRRRLALVTCWPLLTTNSRLVVEAEEL